MLDSLLIPFEATTNGVGLKLFFRDFDCERVAFIKSRDAMCIHITGGGIHPTQYLGKGPPSVENELPPAPSSSSTYKLGECAARG